MTAEAGPSLAVVLFTDLVGSTAQRAALGEERADELRQIHDRLIGERIEAHTGRVVKGLGDGLMAVFASASDALTAAVEAQQAVCVHNQRPDALAALSVRMGLSVGDVSWEHGECFGTPAVEAARLVAQAEGGQILCSDFVRVMARGRGGHRFAPVGALTLKGLPEPLEACEVAWEPPEHLAAERLPFPPSLVVRSPLTFVEREEEMALAERHLGPGDGLRVLWLVGEPGIGKTRLAAELARRAYDRGCDVLSGRCDEDLVVPFQPFLSALRDFMAATPAAALAERLGRQPTELARLLPELVDVLPGAAPAAVADAGMERYRLYEAVRSWLDTTATARPLLIILDDLQWADTATIALLAYLARNAGATPLRILGTVRDTEPAGELRRLLDDPALAARTMALGGLGSAGVGRLVGDATGRSSAWDATGLAGQIFRDTGGNPLFVSAVLAGLEPSRRATKLPGDVSAAVRSRTSRLPTAAQRLLRVAAIVGLEFDLRVVSCVLEMPVPDALEAADAAMTGHLVEEIGVNQYRFSHGLVRSALQDEIGASRAAHYHGQVGAALEAVHGDRLEPHVDALAYHFGEALVAGGPIDKALRYTRAAADRAAAQYALETAADHYRRTLELMEQVGHGEGRPHCEVLLALGTALLNSARFGEARPTLNRVAEDAGRGGFDDLLAEAAYQFECAVTFPGLPGDEVVELCRWAAERLVAGDSPDRARVLTGLARGLAHTSRAPDALPVMEDAISMARRVGDARTLSRALWSVPLTFLGPEHMARRLQCAAEGVELAREQGDQINRRNALSVQASTLLEAGRMRELKLALAEYEEVLRDTRAPWAFLYLTTIAGTVALVEGRLDDAEAHATATQDGGAELGGIDREGIFGLQMFAIRREQGRLGGIAPALRVLVERGGDAQAWQPGLAAIHAELGLVDKARDGLEALVSSTEVRLADDSRRSLSLSLLADAAAVVGDQERAAALYRELLPYAGLCIATYNSACYGPASRYLGMLATTMGRLGNAERHFQDSLIGCKRMESPLWMAHTHYHFARMLLTRRDHGDAARAEQLCRAAQETAAGLGMRSLEERAGRLLESGLDVSRRP